MGIQISMILSFSFKFQCSLMVYQKAIDFCRLTFCTATLQQSLFNSRRFFLSFCNFLYRNHDICKQRQFLSFFPYYYYFFFVALARTSSKLLNRSGDTRHPCFVPYLNKKASSSLPLSIGLTIGIFVDILYQEGEVPPLSLAFEELLS